MAPAIEIKNNTGNSNREKYQKDTGLSALVKLQQLNIKVLNSVFL